MKKKIIIVCGLDRCGKSTLVSQLQMAYEKINKKVFYMHSKKPPPGTSEFQREWSSKYYIGWSEMFEFMTTDIVLLDRFHLGEMIYAPMFRHYDTEHAFVADEILARQDTYLILLTDSVERLKERSDGCSLERDNSELIEEVRAKFLDFFEKSKIKKKLHLDLTNVELHDVFPLTKNFLGDLD